MHLMSTTATHTVFKYPWRCMGGCISQGVGEEMVALTWRSCRMHGAFIGLAYLMSAFQPASSVVWCRPLILLLCCEAQWNVVCIAPFPKHCFTYYPSHWEWWHVLHYCLIHRVHGMHASLCPMETKGPSSCLSHTKHAQQLHCNLYSSSLMCYEYQSANMCRGSEVAWQDYVDIVILSFSVGKSSEPRGWAEKGKCRRGSRSADK
jgi:hypothetical protein